MTDKCRRIRREEAIRFFKEARWDSMSSDVLEKVIRTLREKYHPFDEYDCKVVGNDAEMMDVHFDLGAVHLLYMCQEDEPIK